VGQFRAHHDAPDLGAAREAQRYDLSSLQVVFHMAADAAMAEGNGSVARAGAIYELYGGTEPGRHDHIRR
jgi:hypothetical protein